jgi:hypothetical protein
MTDAQLQHKINEAILAHTEAALIQAERDRVTVRSRTPDFEEYISSEVSRLRALRTEYLEKTRVSGEALKLEAASDLAKTFLEKRGTDSDFVRAGAVASPKIAIREE